MAADIAPESDIEHQSPPAQPSHTAFYIIVTILLLIAAALSYPLVKPLITTKFSTDEIVQKPDTSSIPITTPTLTPTPTPIQLHAGKGEYTISHPKSTGPTIYKIIFDPLDVKKGDTLSLSVLVLSDSPVESVTGTFTTDLGAHPLTLIKTGVEGTFQVYSVSVPVTDPVWYSYIVKITAKNASGTTTATVAPRS